MAAFTESFLKELQAVGLGSLVFALGGCFILGGLVGWYFGTKKTRAEIRKLEHESRKLKNEFLDALAGLRKTFYLKKEAWNLAMQFFHSKFEEYEKGTSSVQSVEQYRNELLRLYDNDYREALCQYLERIPVLLEPAESSKRYQGEILDGLKLMPSFLHLVNHPKIMKSLPNAEPFTLSNKANDHLFGLAKKLFEETNPELENEFMSIQKELLPYLKQ